MWALLVALAGAPYPDAIDVLRTGGLKPRMSLLLDSSCSMGWDPRATNCTWFASTHNRGDATLNRNGQMRAVLVGCVEDGDGILDKWHDKVDFSIHDFKGVRAGFGSPLADLKAAAISVPFSGGTPLSRVQDQGGEYMNAESTDGTASSCQSFFHLLLSDGDPNGSDAVLDQDCAGGERLTADRNRPWEASEYLFDRHPDVLCGLSGNQQIATYTLGFGSNGTFSPEFLQKTAQAGGGSYFYASSVPDLINAFDNIMASVTARSQALASVSVGLDTYFTENRAYAGSFQPALSGPWLGNLRRMCLFPPRGLTGAYSTAITTCLFKSSDGETLTTNPDVVDLWTGLPVEGTSLGGAGEVLIQTLGRTPSTPYWGRRNLVTWRAGVSGWVPVHPDTWTEADAYQSGCARFRLINYLHGYTWDADCSTGAPIAVRAWPMTDIVHANPVELRYGTCEDGDGQMRPGQCYVAVPTNDGVLHIFDSATGKETSGLVPAELWAPGVVGRSALGEVIDQPSSEYTHRYYLDGTLALEHEDKNGDGLIGTDERARLVFGLGRGGRAHYVLDVSSMSDGIIDDKVSISPILPTSGTEFGRLLETWSAPALATMPVGDEAYPVAIFATGHEPQYDIAERTQLDGGDQLEFVDEVSQSQDQVESAPCEGQGGLAELNGYGKSGLCRDLLFSGCTGGGSAEKPCYDAAGVPLDRSTVPLTMRSGAQEANALRFRFDTFDLGPNDILRLEDDQGSLVAEYRDDELSGTWTAWVYAPAAVLRLVTDGVDTPHEGYELEEVEYRLGSRYHNVPPSARPPPVLGEDALPALLIAHTDRLVASGRDFAEAATDEALVMVVAKECASLGDRCLDATKAPDLESMVCSITASPSLFIQDGRVEAMYVGDECGQIFKIWTPDQGRTWTARRLINLNKGEIGVSKDHRKLFRQLDVVESVCPGREVVGLYFGTGNVQRPLARDELGRSSATNGRDVIGVIWDHEELPSGVTQDDLLDATDVNAIDPTGALADNKHGWIISLEDDERMLEDPLVFDGTAFFKTFQPMQDAQACSAGTGTERFYAVDNCSAASAAEDQDRSARVVKSEEVSKTSPLLFVAPKNAEPMVLHTDLSAANKAVVGPAPRTRPSLFLWREIP